MTIDSANIIAAKKSPEMLEYLLHRRSVSIKQLSEPGPDEEQLQTILRAAARVPDHGKLFPWYFMVLEGDARKDAGKILGKAWKAREPEAAPAKIELEEERFMRAPLVIAVISRARKGKHPLWEQLLSAGAACHNLCLAAHALGFGSNWVTEWYAYDETVKKELGLDARDHVAGFIYIGTPQDQPEERDRPDLNIITTHWKPGAALNKGDEYDRDKLGFPDMGFDFSDI